MQRRGHQKPGKMEEPHAENQEDLWKQDGRIDVQAIEIKQIPSWLAVADRNIIVTSGLWGKSEHTVETTSMDVFDTMKCILSNCC